ncbi:MAG: hypothetical protein EBZ77_13715 [Chitinophagia bacterium]|nr:hypothetical protein [Chitinophagia bacterium]
MFYCEQIRLGHHQHKMAKTVAPIQTTVYGNNQLAGYVVYPITNNNADTQYAVVIRNIDPATDDYQTMAKAIIYDLASKADTTDVRITIYDSTEAYQLCEQKLTANNQILTNDEELYVNSHTVASFEGNDAHEAGVLTFYPFAGNQFTNEETFTL